MVEAKSERAAEERRLERERNRAFLADAHATARAQTRQAATTRATAEQQQVDAETMRSRLRALRDRFQSRGSR